MKNQIQAYKNAKRLQGQAPLLRKEKKALAQAKRVIFAFDVALVLGVYFILASALYLMLF